MSAVLSRRDDPEAGTHDVQQYRERALDDLVERMLDHESYPREVSRRHIDLIDILSECDQGELAAAVCRGLLFPNTLDEEIAPIVRNYLRDTEWQERRAEELYEQDKEDQDA